MHTFAHPVTTALALAILSTGSTAQTTPPDAGALRQQIEQGREANLPRQALPAKPATPEAMRPLSGVVITVTQFRLVGNTLLSTEQLQPALAPFLHRALDYTQLQAAAAAVADVYRAAGWIVRAYLPQQDIKDGSVTIQIVEAVFGGTKLEGAAAKRVALAQIQRGFDAQQKVGEPLNAAALDRALLLADDLPGVAVSGSLREGALPGQTDLVIKLADEPLLVGEAALDNTGARSTGANRLTANLNLNSPFQHGDLLSANLIHTDGSDYVRVGGTLPVGDKGWRVGANASSMNYRLVTAEFAALDAKGTSNTTGLEASYPLVRSRLKNLYFNANADFKSYDNQASGATSTNYKANTLTLALNGNLFDKFGGGGANAASLAFTSGQLDLGSSPNQAADAASTQTDGAFNKLRYSASRQQVITDDLSFFAALSGQWASKNLDSSEKFYLGGASGVRAYPSSEAGGASGQLLNLELRYRLPQGLNLSGFYDFGAVTVNANNSFAGAPALNDYSLKGVGLSLAWQSSAGLNLKGSWARRIGDNPNPTATGNDQDGSLVLGRFWLTASMPF
jgi:hemolysin activation/secretion protein